MEGGLPTWEQLWGQISRILQVNEGGEDGGRARTASSLLIR